MKTLLHYLLKETFVIFATVKSTTTLLFSFAPSGSDNAFENQVNIKPLSSNQIRRMFLFAVFLFTTSNMVGQVTITTATGGTNISADKAGNASVPTYSTLGNIVITESSSAKNEFQPGVTNATITLSAPSGWGFNPATGSVSAAASNNITSQSISVTASSIVVTYSCNSSTAKQDVLTITGIQVRATEGGNVPGSGNVIFSALSNGISGITAGTTVAGALSQTVGAMSHLVVTLPGQTFADVTTLASSGNTGTVTPQTVGTAFTISKLTATDQFFNVITTYTGAKTIAYSGPGTSTGGSPTYITSVTFASGVSSTTLTTSLRKAEAVAITAKEGTSFGLASSSLVVNPKALTVTSPSATSKTYNGTAIAAITGTLSGFLIGDVVTLSGTGTFIDANVGTGKTVTSTSNLNGTDAANYSLTQPTGLSANITAAALTITGLTGVSRSYNGLTTATSTGTAAYSGLQNGESFAVTGTPVLNFSNALVGTGKAITVTGYNSPSSNYTLTQPTGLTANITAAALTITGLTGVSRGYNGLTTATSTGTAAYSGLQNGESFAVTGTSVLNFSDKNVGTGKTITVTGYTAPSSNYTVSQPSLTADITAAALTITGLTGVSKAYNGLATATSTGTAAYVGLQTGDSFSVAGTPVLNFSDALVGTAKAITVTGYTAPSSNYTLTQPSLTANITAAALTITGLTGVSRSYNGLTTATSTGTAAYSGLQNGESFAVTDTPVLNFSNALVGTAKAITVTGYTAPSSNYTLTQPGLTANITAAALTITGLSGVSRVYNGLTTAISTGTAAYSGLQNGESFAVTGTPVLNFSDKNIGTAKAITVTGYTAPNSNYTLTQPGLTADITAAALTITGLSGVSRNYNGLTTATSSGTAAYVGLQTGDTFSVTGTPVLNFSDALVGTAKSITVTGYTAPSSNYILTEQPTGLTADITAAALTITGLTGVSRGYNGLTTATSSGTAAYSGLQNGESFTVTDTPVLNFSNALVGTGKTIIVTGYTAPSSNYTLTQPVLTADITAVNLTITGLTGVSRIYNGLTTAKATGTPAYSGLENGESFAVTGTPVLNFSDKNIGTGKTITVTGYTAPNSNYTVNQPTDLTADITAASITITGLTGVSRSYNGLTTATSSGTAVYVGLQSGDSFSVAGTPVLNFSDALVGTAKAITVTGYTEPSSNYILTEQPTGLTADITPAILAITGLTGLSRAYNGLTTATAIGTAAYSGLQNGESFDVADTPVLNFSDALVGTGKAIIVTGYTAPSSNYTVTQPVLTADITAVALTIAGLSGVSRGYNGLTTATSSGTATYSGLVNGESFAVTGTPVLNFSDKNIGIGKTITVTGYTAPNSNYTVTQPTGLTADITAAALTITGLTGVSRSYNGLTIATSSGTAAYVGLQSGDSFSVTGTPVLNFSEALVGTGKEITVTGYTAPSSNYILTGQPSGLTADITPAILTITGLTGVSRAYNGLTTATATGTAAYSGLQNGESFDVTDTPVLNFSDALVGTGKAIIVTGYTAPSSNYIVTQPVLTADITAVNLTITGLTGVSRAYNGLTTATSSGTAAYSGLVNGESFAVTGTPVLNFSDKNIGTDKTITITGYTAPSSNYTVTQPSLTADITAAALTITGLTGVSRAYNGLTTATSSGTAAYAGLQSGDTFSVTGTPVLNFSDVLVGTGKAITVTGYTAPSSNYTVTQPTGLTANITAAALTITGLTGVSRSYNGLTTATSSGTAAYSGLQNGESFAVTGTPVLNFSNALVGTGKAITVTGYTAPSSNYTLTQPSLTANITAAALTITGLTGVSRAYNGLTTATSSGTAAYSGLQNGESFAVTGTPVLNFSDKNIGTGKTITVTGYTAPSSNYTLTQQGLTADITAAALTITGLTGVSRAYNGLTTATSSGTPAYAGLQTGDAFSVTGTPVLNFSDALVGTAKVITVTGYTAPSSNYTLTQPSLTANITAAALTITGLTGVSRAYNGLTTATSSGTAAYSGLQNGESFAVTGTPVLNFSNALVGTGKAITVTGYTAPSSNYTLTQPTGLTANITAATLTITGLTGVSRTYNGLTTATSTGTATYSGLQNGELFAVTGTPVLNFSDKNVGTGKTITVTGYTAPSSNYTVSQPSLTADITAAALTITGLTGVSRTYNGLTTATSSGTPAYAGLQSGDSFSVAGTPVLNFSNKNVGTGKTITVTGYTAPSSNYTVTQPSLTANITAVALTITAVQSSKVYDGTTSSPSIPTVTGTIEPGDTAAFIQTYNSKTVATAKTLIPSGSVNDGNGGNNYTYTFVNLSNGSNRVITALSITIASPAVTSKIYDGTTAAIITGTLTGVIAGDIVTLNGTGTFNTKNVGTNKAVTSTSTLSGLDGGNYSVTQPTGLTGIVTVRALTVTGAAISKTYDGTTSSATVPTITSGAVQTGDTAAFTQTYDTKNIGTGKTITPAGVVTDGNSGNNYSYTFVNSTNGTITARALTITGAANSKTYDATTTSATVPTITSGTLQTGDTAAFIQIYDTKNVGTGKTMTPSGVVTDGNSGNNYSYTFVNSTNGTITARAVTITGAANSKIYDATTTSATVPTITSGTLQTGDTAAFTQTYNTKNVGTGKTMTPAGVVTDGNSGNNYSYTFVFSTNGTITARALTITGVANSKTYDGTTSSATVPTITSGTLQSGDTAAFTQTYDTKNVGTGKTMTPAGVVTDGNSGNNYSYTFVFSTNGTITAKSVTVTANNGSKCFGITYSLGTNGFSSVGLISGETIDSVTLTSAGASSSAAVGSYNIVPSAATGATFTATNYNITYSNGTLTVIALPNAPIGSNGSRCNAGTVAIAASAGSGETVDWYNASSGGTLLAGASPNYTTPSISTTTTYYAESRNTTTGCVSGARTAVIATITPSTTNTTTASACDSYTWSVNGQSYTASGNYSVVSGCHTEVLALTITPSTSNTTTASDCDSYIWSVNGQSYSASGNYSVVSGCHTEVLALTITPSTSNTTTASACDSYTWSVNGQSYTASGNYSVVSGCHTEVLALTITPSTSNTTTASDCDSYIWSVNGQSYSASGNYSVVSGCHTEVLALTITPSTSNTTTALACDSYTWSVNGQSYTASGNYSVVSGCHTEVLALTITPSTSNTTTASACDSYTWSVNGTTYTASGNYSVVSGCHTEVLALTITPSTSNTTTASACDSYTWSVNGQSYTASGNYSVVSGCHTEVLALTITPSTLNITTASACDSYTWSVNGQSYTASGNYSVVSGCHTEVLALTITPSTSNTTTASACDSYTWSVNAQSYTASGNYSVVSGCHTEILALTITPSTSNTTTASACDSYTWSVNGTTYTASGNYSVVSGCHTEVLALTITPSTTNTTTASACDSYTWSVNGTTYTASGNYSVVSGCHTEVLALTITPSTTNTTTASACDSYTWSVNGQSYTASGNYSVVSGCHTEVLALTITPSTTNTTTASACDSYTWSVNGQSYTASGNYSVVSGCHTEVLALTITPSTSNTTTASACDSYTWSVNGQSYTASGNYSVVSGCHTEVLVLTITPSTTNTTTASACDSYTWSVNGQSYTASGNYSVVSGCHTEVLTLIINNSTTSEETVTACDFYVWNGTTYSTSGDYEHIGTNVAGCKNTATLHLTINNSSSSSESDTACDSYTWSANGATYTTSGTYTSTGTNAAGCTYTKTLILTINQSTSSTETQTACGSYFWPVNNQTYTTVGTNTYTSIGTNVAGCTDTKTLVLTITNGSSVYYADTDADGYGDASSSTQGCSQPLGYVTDNTDCDDDNASVNPGASEVANGIDDDCDGFIDEGGLIPAAPGVTNLILCKGTPSVTLTATAFAGYTLKWYTTNIITTALASAPVATTATVGSKSWWVTQRLGTTGPESARAQITVTILPLPTEVLGPITSNTESTTTPGTYLAATTAIGVYVGTTTPVTYRVPTFTDTSLSYYWAVPTGVTVVSQTANTLTVNFLGVSEGVGAVGIITVQAENVNGCRTAAKSVALTKVLPAAPAAIKMTDALLPVPTTGIPTAVTSFAKYMGTNTVLTLTATASLTATSYVWELPTGVNVVSGDPLTDRIITVNFSGVTSLNTFNYSTTASVPVSTNILRIGVKSRNGVGYSTTSNAALVNPTTTSTAKLLTLKATAPAAPGAVKLTNDAINPLTAVTIISKYVGTNTPLTLTATASALASSYEWELPSGVNVVSGNPLTDRIITVKFNGIPSGVTSYYIGAKAKNGIGYSVTNNPVLTPATTSTAKLLKVTTSLPAAASAVSGQIVALCGGSTYSYTMTASALANSYVITAPTNAVVTSASNTGNNSNVLSTSDLTFSVAYPAGFVIGTTTTVANKSIVIASVNGVGNSATNKVLTLATALGAIGTNTNSYVNPNTAIANATLFGKCATQTITVPGVPYATSYVWTLQNGATGTSTTNSIVVNFSAVPTLTAITKNIVKVKAYNGCTYSVEKSITLSWDGIMDCPGAKQATPEVTVLPTRAPFTVKAYPNPYTENFNLSLTTVSEDKVGIVVYDMTGRLIERREVRVSDIVEQQIGDHYPSGVYNVVVTQGEEVKTLRVIKR